MKNAFPILFAFIVLMFIALVPAMAQEGPDENEPNDSIDQADSISELEFAGEVGGRRDDGDWFVLEGQEGLYAAFTIYYDDRECDIDMEIYSDEDLVGSVTTVASPDSVICEIPGVCYVYVYAYDSEGEYTVEIEPMDEDEYYDEAGDLPSGDECAGEDEVEPNDDMDLADSIDGLEIEGYACEGESDWFVLEGQEGYYPTFILEYDEDECDIDMEIYSEDELVGSLTSAESPDEDGFEVEDTCYLHVYSFTGEGDYFIEIQPEEDEDRDRDRDSDSDCEGPDEVEPNDEYDLADYIEEALYIEGYACEGDVDWYRLGGQEGRRPTITITYDEDECDLDVEIYSDDEIVGYLNSTDSPDSDEFRIPGECWLKVYAYDGEGDYEIEIEP